MRYFGGKKRIAKYIIEYLHPYIEKTKYYFEPFVGSGAILEGIKGKKFASDKNEYLIEMYLALQKGWLPPQNVSEEEYYYIKENQDENKALSGFVGFGCSHSGKWWGGYCRDGTNRNYALNAYNSIIKQKDKILDVNFKAIDYFECHPKHALVYCDPPYAGTAGYAGMGTFDTNKFWDIMRLWSQNNIVFISEYQSPKDFKCV
jgi:DNA adenine methylase